MTTMTPTAPPTVRLLAAYHESGRAAGLRDHLERHGPVPPPAAGQHLIEDLEEAGLTGRDGAGLPVARTLRAVVSSGRTPVVVVDSADREPAGGKDRLLLAIAPHLVLDGAVLTAIAVGADEIVHGEEAAAAVAERHRAGLTGTLIRMTHAGLDREDPVAVDGRAYAERPYVVGGRPKLVLDAETCAHIALIARHGPAWFRACGTEEAPGTALFTVSGAVVRPGVVEAPTGTSVGALLRMAGGPSEPVQAILTGGYSGTWLPPALLEVPATPSLLARAGATLGAGIVIALPARVSGLAESARVLGWLADRNTGRCGPCLTGLPAVAADFAALAAGTADEAVRGRLDARLSMLTGPDACRHSVGPARFAISALRVFGSPGGAGH
ncbi:SLBB domain-containing protein [Actinomadura sp. DC4]|uniref:SLBB domain-containing protein n=1 Tax=Actinomadura sp. DC4 TaxID=3055069 RepID=UPI0025B1D0C8|nr:SLBB domain-containing protein [Actinomadura sp. DC4]MDN3357969.1 SLBB domain-containing protein [Actinomadura sp. DC4]